MKTFAVIGNNACLGLSSFSQNAYYDARSACDDTKDLGENLSNTSRGGAKRTFFGYLDTKSDRYQRDYEAIKSFVKKAFYKVNNELNTINQFA